VSKKEISIAKKAQEVSTKDLDAVLNFAQLEYKVLAVDVHRPDLHLARCYTSAVLHLLSSQGYSLVKQNRGEGNEQ
jgi:hypothetical protein